MELFLIRHAIAVPGSMLLADADRPLTPKGRKRFSQAVLGLQHLKVRFDRLYHSPWRRAVETAELLAPVWTARRCAARPWRVHRARMYLMLWSVHG